VQSRIASPGVVRKSIKKLVWLGGIAPMTTTYAVRAKRWKHDWELHIDGIGFTQSRNLDGAEQMVRDYIETLTDSDTSDDRVVIHPEVGGGLDEAAQSARQALAEAEQALRAAAARSRQVAHRLKLEGLSGRDIAAILHVSAQRVSQLLRTLKTPVP
jgi:DNA-directed RNA polymerase specialized sigma24 family protein